jgi:hypothetical protein
VRINTNDRTVWENIDIGNNLYVRNGANIGPGGLYVDSGEVAIDSNSGATAFRLNQRGSGDILNIFDGSTEVVTVLDGGNVGIGTSNPSDFTLQVAGDIGPDSAPTQSSSSTSLNRIADVPVSASYSCNSSIAIGNDGYPVITYHDYTDTPEDLFVAKCSSADCSSVSSTTEITDDGLQSSVAIGTDGYPVISHQIYNSGSYDFEFVKCSNAACTSSSRVTIDTSNTGESSSIAIAADGNPIMTYYDDSTDDLMVAKCSDTSCSSFNTYTVESTNSVGLANSIAIGTDGLPIISYYETTNYYLKVAKCGDVNCSTSGGYTINTIDTALGTDVYSFTSITVGEDSLPIIAYTYEDASYIRIKVAKCNDIQCTSSGGYTTTVISGNYNSYWPSIKIGRDGLPVVSFMDRTNIDLEFVWCGNSLCSNGNRSETIDASNAGLGSSVAIGNDGLPIVSYFVNTPTDGIFAAKIEGKSWSGGSNLGSREKFFNNSFATNYWAKEGLQISNFDLAEDYKVNDESITAGDVVAIDSQASETISKTTKQYQSSVMGVISTEPGIRLTEWDLDEEERLNMRPVALAGKVPVKVTTENGSIKKGDRLVPSSTPGYAMKACGNIHCSPSVSVGMALEDFSNYAAGDSEMVKEEFQDTRVEIQDQYNQVSEEINEAIEKSQDKQEQEKLIDQRLQAEEIVEVVNNLTEQIETTNGFGRVMMFINLGYHNPESTQINNSATDLSLVNEILLENEVDQELLDTSLSWTPRSDTGILSIDSLDKMNNVLIENLYITKKATTLSLSIEESIVLGKNLVIQSTTNSENNTFTSINTLSNPLSIQTTALQPINIMGNNIQIDTEGNISLTGNLDVDGTTKASRISTDNLSLNQENAGSSIITKNEKSTTIYSTNLHQTSLIYITPTSPTGNKSLFVSEKVSCIEGDSDNCEPRFVVSIIEPFENDINFNWLIVNSHN